MTSTCALPPEFWWTNSATGISEPRPFREIVQNVQFFADRIAQPREQNSDSAHSNIDAIASEFHSLLRNFRPFCGLELSRDGEWLSRHVTLFNILRTAAHGFLDNYARHIDAQVLFEEAVEEYDRFVAPSRVSEADQKEYAAHFAKLLDGLAATYSHCIFKTMNHAQRILKRNVETQRQSGANSDSPAKFVIACVRAAYTSSEVLRFGEALQFLREALVSCESDAKGDGDADADAGAALRSSRLKIVGTVARVIGRMEEWQSGDQEDLDVDGNKEGEGSQEKAHELLIDAVAAVLGRGVGGSDTSDADLRVYLETLKLVHARLKPSENARKESLVKFMGPLSAHIQAICDARGDDEDDIAVAVARAKRAAAEPWL